MKKSEFSWIFAVLLATTPALAAPEQGISVYPAAFFADSRPATANDMISRLPGFTLDTGTSARGFAGTAGNVLIDGARPTAKTDDLDSVLNRIPAASVERIDVIRGGAPGIDMQGQSVVANIVRSKEVTSQTIVNLNTTYLGSGQWVPYGGIEYHGQSGGTRYEATIARTAQVWDDSPGTGFRTVTLPGGAPQYDRARSTGVMQLGYKLHGAIITSLWGGEWNNNLTLQNTDYPSGIAYSGDGGSRFDTIQRIRNGEFGSHWQGVIGDYNLETLLLQRLAHEDDGNTSAAPDDSAVFLSSNDTSESIARATVRRNLTPTLGLEAGGEGAYNYLKGRSSFVDNSTTVAVPNANVTVDERRAEIFANASWKIDTNWSLEGGARFEYSVIAESGDTHNSRNFFYPKPRLLLSWSPDDKSQLRLRVEKVLGQLKFTDFVASSDLAGNGVAAGNANLRPEQRWQFEATIERHFWDKGAIVVSVLHEEIKDLQDYIPVGGGFDAPGNIAHATNDKLSVNGTLPLDWLGIHNGLLKATTYWTQSALIDPLTGETRRISGSSDRDRNVGFDFTQDLDDWKSTWGVTFGAASNSWHNWRIDQIGKIGIHEPYLQAFWSYKPSTNWMITIGSDNILPYRFENTQYNYTAPRNVAPPPTVQQVFVRTEPRIYLKLRKTF
ncbi:MAG TPA: TonB-dependent receptor [Rhizomicrobium sp.]|jgi:outer membrane receptor protein involved in Fe transport